LVKWEWPATPLAGMGVVEPFSWTIGWFGHPQREKGSSRVTLAWPGVVLATSSWPVWGRPNHSHGPWRWFGHPQTDRPKVAETTLSQTGVAEGPLGVARLPPFFFGGGRTTPWTMGVIRPPPYRLRGWLPLFFFFFFFNFFLIF
jgi:hypothetical protein